MTRNAIQSFSLLLAAIAFPGALQATEPAKAIQFPVTIRIVEAKPESLTNFTVRLNADQGVDIYANQPRNAAWNHVAARLTVRGADGKAVDARVSYPDGIEIGTDFFGDLHVYRDAVDMTVTIADDEVKHPLSLTLEGAGYNRLRSFCLGKMKLETTRR
jgi:hypothetical protein